MAHPARPSILVFDVNETLLDLDALTPLFERIFGPPGMLREWFAQLILYSQALSLAGIYVPFGELAHSVLAMLASIHGVALTASDQIELQTLLGTLPAHPDALPALRRLRAAGFRLVTLTNSAPAPHPAALERAGLADMFERTFSIDAVRRFKPAPETYQHVATSLGTDTSDLCLIAAHTWDTLGAAAAGCSSALVTRGVNAPLAGANIPQPLVQAQTLTELTDRLLHLWATIPPAVAI